MANKKGPSSERQESGRSRRVGTNLFGKGQRVISDSYREGYENTQWEKPKTQKGYEKLGFKVVIREMGSATHQSDDICAGCNNDCSVC